MSPPADRRRTVLALRLFMTFAVAAVALPEPETPRGTVLAILAASLASNLLLLVRPSRPGLGKAIEMLLFAFDMAAVVGFMLLSGETRSPFYVIFFLIILLAALSHRAKAAVALAFVCAVVYALFIGSTRPEEFLEIGFTTRVALFFVAALFAGRLAEEAHAAKAGRRRFEGFYRALFDCLSDGAIVADASGTVIDANARASEILGLDPRGRPAPAALAAGPTAEGSALFTVELRRPDGTTAPCEVASRAFDADGESYRLYLVRDVEPVRRIHRRLAELERMGSLGQLVGSIAHEINNPMTCILGYAEMVQDQGLNETARDYVARITEAGLRCRGVLEGLLNQYRARPAPPRRIRLSDSVRSTVRLMEFHLRYHLVRLELQLDEDAELTAEAQQVEQMLVNLMCNAVQAMQGRTTRVLRVRVAREAEEAVLQVSDTGCGIPDQDRKKLFQPGFTARPDGSGHGIGLVLCQEIAARHGGSIAVDSRPGEGTTFTVRLRSVAPPPGSPRTV